MTDRHRSDPVLDRPGPGPVTELVRSLVTSNTDGIPIPPLMMERGGEGREDEGREKGELCKKGRRRKVLLENECSRREDRGVKGA